MLFAWPLHQEGALLWVARELDIAEVTLHSWVEASSPSEGPLSEDERRELLALRREVNRLQLEQEILKKAAAFFDKGKK